jgi:hypothetical protein
VAVSGMTTRLSGLVVENAKFANLITRTLDLEFGEFDWKVEWETTRRAVDARQAARRKPPFDIAIVDYALGEGQQNGSAVVGDLRDQSEQTFILVINSRPSRYSDYISQSLLRGANHALMR